MPLPTHLTTPVFGWLEAGELGGLGKGREIDILPCHSHIKKKSINGLYYQNTLNLFQWNISSPVSLLT